ncbi:MAG: amidase [Halobacteriales archaeon]|nr:amidase [Halobacteriales archaeon]
MVEESLLVGSIEALGTALRDDRLTVVELTEAYLDRLERVGPELNAVVTVTRERARQQAERLDEEFDAGTDRGPLHGIPFGVKDLLSVKDHPTTWGAAPLQDQTFDEDATVVERLEAAGGVLLGKLSSVELAGGFGYEQADAAFNGPGRNAWDPDAWSGGSSSGPGSAVPAGCVGFAIGSETWGSIITPAGYNGVAGHRPTYGAVSRAGAMALSWTMDKIGPLCRTARGCEQVLEAIAGPDPRDTSTVDRSLDTDPTAEPTLGVFEDVTADIEPAVGSNYEESLAVLEDFATIEPIELPEYPYNEVADLLIGGEAAAAFDTFVEAGHIEDLTAPADRVGGYAQQAIPAKDYINAMRVRRKLQRDVDQLFDTVDAIVAPSLATVAPPIDTPFAEYRDPHELPPIAAAANVAGLPGVTIPNGFGDRELPTGITFTGRAFADLEILDYAARYQGRTDHVDYTSRLGAY